MRDYPNILQLDIGQQSKLLDLGGASSKPNGVDSSKDSWVLGTNGRVIGVLV